MSVAKVDSVEIAVVDSQTDFHDLVGFEKEACVLGTTIKYLQDFRKAPVYAKPKRNERLVGKGAIVH